MNSYKPLDTWIASVNQNRDLLTHEDRVQILEDLNRTLAVRDALIMTALTDDRGRDRTILDGFINDPHAPEYTKLMEEMLSKDFYSPVDEQTEQRTDTIATMLNAIILEALTADPTAPENVAQPLAMKAYLEWFSNQDGREDAEQALDFDCECSLAAIVANAYSLGIHRGR